MDNCLTVYTTFEGLGFCCFNPERQGAEIAFLRLPKHDLKISIVGSNGRQQVFDQIADDAKIELVSQETAVQGFRLNNNGAFDRQKGLDSDNDPLDLRWLVDFEGAEMHDRKATPQNKMPGSVWALTEMFLPNAYFYTEQVLSGDYEIEETDVSSGSTTNRPFGSIGETLGARVDAMLAALHIDGEEVFRFDKGVDPRNITRFLVTITNICEEIISPPPHSDFHKYYEAMDFKSDIMFDFNLPKMNIKRPRPLMCEFTWLSKTQSLEDFFNHSPAY